MFIHFEYTHLYSFLFALAVALTVLRLQGKSLVYIFFCAVFGVYLIGVISVVVFPLHIPEPGFESGPHFNLAPFDFGGCSYMPLCARNIYENILLTVPFGFGISFIASIKPRYIFQLAIVVGATFEFIQLIVALIVRSPFRVVDINDVIFNATGVLLGYGIFKLFGWLYLTVIHKLSLRPKHIFADIYDIVT